MTYDEFKNVVHTRFSTCEDILTAKSHEYAPNQDRLEQFKITAMMQECTPIRALGGMMVKHTATLHQFINDPQKYTIAQWQEKISDTINYCLLLEGLLVEQWCETKIKE